MLTFVIIDISTAEPSEMHASNWSAVMCVLRLMTETARYTTCMAEREVTHHSKTKRVQSRERNKICKTLMQWMRGPEWDQHGIVRSHRMSYISSMRHCDQQEIRWLQTTLHEKSDGKSARQAACSSPLCSALVRACMCVEYACMAGLVGVYVNQAAPTPQLCIRTV